MAKEKLYDLWIKRNPDFERKYEDFLRQFTDYGKKANSIQTVKGLLFGPAYEMLIIAFFIGLYMDRKRPLIEDKTEVKSLGQPIQYWGNSESRNFRKAYPKIREYMFMALVAKADLDLIELDKGNIKDSEIIKQLMITMESYINSGLYYLNEKLQDNPDFLYRTTGLIDIFLSTTEENSENQQLINNTEPESLD